MFAKQFYWYKLRGLLFKLRRPQAFQLSLSYWVHIDWLAPGYLMGAGNPTISRETETQVPAACQPQPRQPHRGHGCHFPSRASGSVTSLECCPCSNTPALISPRSRVGAQKWGLRAPKTAFPAGHLLPAFGKSDGLHVLSLGQEDP